jgi:hypothetical protein
MNCRKVVFGGLAATLGALVFTAPASAAPAPAGGLARLDSVPADVVPGVGAADFVNYDDTTALAVFRAEAG